MMTQADISRRDVLNVNLWKNWTNSAGRAKSPTKKYWIYETGVNKQTNVGVYQPKKKLMNRSCFAIKWP